MVAAERAGSASLVSISALGVRYDATEALAGVDLELLPGEVHALVGENGAGKSTLLRALAGAVKPSSGVIRVRDATAIAWVPQEADVAADLTAAEWIFLGDELRRFGLVRRAEMRAAASAALSTVGCAVAPTTPLGAMPVAQRKQVQLARALRAAPDVLLLDEPTAVLGDAETRHLFAAVRAERARGAAVLYVSHRLKEVLEVADRVTVLRDGRRVSTDPVAAVTAASLVERMVGREIAPATERRVAFGADVLRIAGLAVAHVRGVSFAARAGEIVGLAGLVGAGRSEILETVAGVRRRSGGTIEVRRAPILVPEDRSTKGLIGALRLRENLFLPAPHWRLDRPAERRAAKQWIERLSIRARGSESAVGELSGGNQQKLLLARALRHEPGLLLLDEPTAGVDVGAKAEIHEWIRRLAAGGAAVVLASSDLPELLALSDTVVALYDGRLAGIVPRAEASEARLAALITGVDRAHVGAA